jgi:hypothetical protein
MARRTVVMGVLILALSFVPRSASASIIIGGSLFVEQDGNVFVEYLGDFAGFTDSLFLAEPANGFGVFFTNNDVLGNPGDQVDLGFHTAGTELIFGLSVSETGLTFFTGPGSANPDGIPHAQVFTNPASDIDPAVLASILPTWAPGDGVIVGFEDLDALHPAFDNDFNDLMFSFRNVTTAVPEPTTLLLISTGAVGLLARSRRKNRKK